jgi:hypothetical protein
MSLSTLTIYDADNNAVSLYLGTSLAEKQSGLEIKAEGQASNEAHRSRGLGFLRSLTAP